MTNLKHETGAEWWATLIKERTDSRMTIKEWCREKDIKEFQYYYWLKILRGDETATHSGTQGLCPSWNFQPFVRDVRKRMAELQPLSGKEIFP